MDRLLEMVPATLGNCYFEPFFGGGALFFAMGPERAVISDRNEELMNCYRAIRDDPRAVEAELRKLPDARDGYYIVRRSVASQPAERAARLIYLVTHSFNGIYRVNQEGEFNVPYGERAYTLGQPMSLEPYSNALAKAEIRSGDFSVGLRGAAQGDVAYLDPPYTVTHSRNGFLKYNARVFSWPDQRRLARVARVLLSRGCHVIVSNADHESIDGLYGQFRPVPVSRISRMAADASHRRIISELVYTSVEET